MAIRMPGPVVLANSVYHLNVRIPKDLAATLRGAAVTLPVDGKDITVKIGDKVIVSLRTKDAREAKVRFKLAATVLDLFFDAMRASPKTLSHKQIAALSGDAYRAFVAKREAEINPGHFDLAQDHHEAEIRSWMFGENGKQIMAREDADFFATLSMPDGPALLAWTRGGVDNQYLKMTENEALEHLFGRQADDVALKRGLRLDEACRIALLKQIGQSHLFATGRLKKLSQGDFSPDGNLSRFPAFRSPEKIDIPDLFSRWQTHNKDTVKKSTVRRYTPTVNSLAAFLNGKDFRDVQDADILNWAKHRRDVDGIAARTVNRNDLVAASSIFAFATEIEIDLRKDNPVKGIKLKAPDRTDQRQRTFRSSEIKAILTLARSVEITGKYPRAAASRRWVPFICAYLGARVQEPCWLRKQDFRREDGIWVLSFQQTKDGNARVVPLHEALIDEGLVAFVSQAPDGFLFVGDRPRKGKSDRTIQEQRASELATWVQKNIGLEEGVDPNHGWRHTWISKASSIAVNIDKRHQNAINGHNKNKDASDGYCYFPVKELKEALDKYPKYEL